MAFLGGELGNRLAPGCMQHTIHDLALRELLVKLVNEHRELDAEIVRLEIASATDQLQIKRLKKRKLILKDRISSLEDRLLPDIIA